MTILKRPDIAKISKFIDAGSDQGQARGRQRKKQISLTVPAGLLAKADSRASELGISRAALIIQSVAQFLNQK